MHDLVEVGAKLGFWPASGRIGGHEHEQVCEFTSFGFALQARPRVEVRRRAERPLEWFFVTRDTRSRPPSPQRETTYF